MAAGKNVIISSEHIGSNTVGNVNRRYWILWFSESINLIHTITDSVWWLKKKKKKRKLPTFGLISMLTWGKRGPVSSLWCQSFGRCLNQEAGEGPTLCLQRILRTWWGELLQTPWIHLAPKMNTGLVSNRHEEWRPAGTSPLGAPGRDVCFALCHCFYWMILAGKSKHGGSRVRRFPDTRLRCPTFCPCPKF